MARRMVSQKQEGAKKSSGSRNRRGLSHYFFFCSFCLTHSFLFHTIYCQPQSVERFYSHDHSMQRLSRARLDRICCGLWRHRTTAEAVEASQSMSFEESRGRTCFHFQTSNLSTSLRNWSWFQQLQPQRQKPTGKFQAKRSINLNFVRWRTNINWSNALICIRKHILEGHLHGCIHEQATRMNGTIWSKNPVHTITIQQVNQKVPEQRLSEVSQRENEHAGRTCDQTARPRTCGCVMSMKSPDCR